MPDQTTLKSVRNEINTCAVFLRLARNQRAGSAAVALENARRAHRCGMNLLELLPESDKAALIEEMGALAETIAALSRPSSSHQLRE